MTFRTIALATVSAMALSVAPALAADSSADSTMKNADTTVNAEASTSTTTSTDTAQSDDMGTSDEITGSTDAAASDSMDTQGTTSASNKTATEQKVSSATNGEWLTLTGKVKDVSADEFKLDYGQDAIHVEMDGFGTLDGNPIHEGDHVTVSGLIDADFLQNKTIEASSVYVDSLGTYFYADPADEEDAYLSYFSTQAADQGDWLALTGTVQKISDDQITLDIGSKTLTVDTDDLAYDVNEEDSPWELSEGDRVSITGKIDDADLFDQRELNATSLVVLSG